MIDTSAWLDLAVRWDGQQWIVPQNVDAVPGRWPPDSSCGSFAANCAGGVS
jgi:hypothetical protein